MSQVAGRARREGRAEVRISLVRCCLLIFGLTSVASFPLANLSLPMNLFIFGLAWCLTLLGIFGGEQDRF